MEIICTNSNSATKFADLEIGYNYVMEDGIFVKSSKDSAINLQEQELVSNIDGDMEVEEIEITKLEYNTI